ncbi:hypothetical protein CfE428DRAFT_5355 [Chthoniobacter flavus Ellin428]|uniref:Uncharacterized protein n=1 Tax=Chthoniobacter flavus Ellin428 TaxID=497964 RepID=B4D8W5_9BACT|nr:hypothetical protein [Chthoniobacter flavus]EDY17173.1 hypothetical protein CfE428DRAFT_5355 [Chthoniobacter flavus Ellin428]TCO90167.1 hypothetical protein EV701_11193 [Chthoniobacter flavus]
MSLGIFRSIRGSYAEPYRRDAEWIVRALKAEFVRRGLPPYVDPEPDERSLRRLPCGNARAATFATLQERAWRAELPWTLGSLRGERQIALPISFTGKFSLLVRRRLLIFPQRQSFCSVQTLHDELLALAPLLHIPLVDGTVAAEIANRLANCEALPDDDPQAASTLENERGLWLDLHLASRYSLEDRTPVVIA